MSSITIPVAYMPLVDAAPLIIAHEMGFAEAENISLELLAAPSWSSVRDLLVFGQVDAAHMLSPVPVAMGMGLGGIKTSLSAVSVLSMNGNVIGISNELTTKLRAIDFKFDFSDPVKAADALSQVREGPLVFGVPFPFSMHVELLRYWSRATALGEDGIEIRTVPPPLMADALASGEVDAFCVGEPWGSVAVERAVGTLLLPGNAIWQFSPEKVLAVRTDWTTSEPDKLGRIMRAVWRAGRWLANPDARATASDLLSRKKYLDVSPELIDRSLSGQMTISAQGEQRSTQRFVEFYHGVASFPWRSQANWIAHQLARSHGVDTPENLQRAARVFRSDLQRQHFAKLACDLPGASEKVEGAIRHETAVASAGGSITLLPDSFFDGQIFDPNN